MYTYIPLLYIYIYNIYIYMHTYLHYLHLYIHYMYVYILQNICIFKTTFALDNTSLNGFQIDIDR